MSVLDVCFYVNAKGPNFGTPQSAQFQSKDWFCQMRKTLFFVSISSCFFVTAVFGRLFDLLSAH